MAYRSFEKLMRKSLWNRVLRNTVGWYIQANSSSGTTEAKIIPSFIALEMLAWALLVEDRGVFSNRRFNNLPAWKKLDALLQELGIPSDIPARFSRLKPAASRRKLNSGPKIFAAVRNALVHPKRSKRRFLSRLHQLTLWELSELGLTYLELAHLAVLGYRGSYSRRVFQGWADEELTAVPWS